MRTDMSSTVTRSSAVGYTGLFFAGTYLSVKKDLRANALGIDTGGTALEGALNGFHGVALAAPWNMILQLWIAVGLMGRPGRTGRRARAWIAFLSAFFLAGSVGEPVSHKIVTRKLPPLEEAIAVTNIALPMVMLWSSLASLVGYGDGKSDPFIRRNQ